MRMNLQVSFFLHQTLLLFDISIIIQLQSNNWNFVCVSELRAATTARQWKEEDYNAQYSVDCQFQSGSDLPGSPIAEVHTKKDCAKKCLDDRECSHFTWRAPGVDRPKCYLKKLQESKKGDSATHLNNAHCGFIPGRPLRVVEKSRPLTPPVKVKISWAEDCKFKGNEINSKRINNNAINLLDQCAEFCAKNVKCTHFTWFADEMCWIKNIPVGSNDNYPAYNKKAFQQKYPSLCGFIEKQ